MQVRKERNGDQIDVETGLLSKITEALIYLSTDKVCIEGLNPVKELEAKLLDETRVHMKTVAAEYLGSSDLAGYVRVAAQVLEAERKRIQ